MIVRDEQGKIIRKGTPGRKYARRLDPDCVKRAEANSQRNGFNEKFVNPSILRDTDESMSPTTWGQLLQSFGRKYRLYAKEVAAAVGIPFDTYRGWLSGKHTPVKIVQEAVLEKIKALEAVARKTLTPPASSQTQV